MGTNRNVVCCGQVVVVAETAGVSNADSPFSPASQSGIGPEKRISVDRNVLFSSNFSYGSKEYLSVTTG
jgi:hypothetical protein